MIPNAVLTFVAMTPMLIQCTVRWRRFMYFQVFSDASHALTCPKGFMPTVALRRKGKFSGPAPNTSHAKDWKEVLANAVA